MPRITVTLDRSLLGLLTACVLGLLTTYLVTWVIAWQTIDVAIEPVDASVAGEMIAPFVHESKRHAIGGHGLTTPTADRRFCWALLKTSPPRTVFVAQVDIGWPMRALGRGGFGTSHAQAWQADAWVIGSPGQMHFLPLRPILPGLLVDSAMWGGLWLGVAATGRAIRRCSRRRHGRCPRCCHDVRHTDRCHECGWQRRQHALVRSP